MLRDAPVLLVAAIGVMYLRERRAKRRLERLGAATLETVLDTIDANNPTTGAHVRRVAEFALILAKAADVDERMQRSVERVALFHDIGKMDGALTDIINETSKLSADERRAVMTHPRRGAEVLQPLTAFYPDLADGVLSHHEWWDGTGYPRRLKGTRIPLVARIVAIADTFDAVTHARSYRPAQSIRVASDVISEGRGTQFDPDLADLFLTPPILKEVAAAMRKAIAPRHAPRTRRSRRECQDVPDITFRWRTPTGVRQS